jgi:hypothetical protein
MARDFRETVRARAERDPAFRKALRQEIRRDLKEGGMSETTAARMRKNAGLTARKRRKRPAPKI